MGEKDLSRALLRLGASELASPPGSHEQVQSVLARDRRRVRIVLAITALFWLAAAAVLYGSLAQLLGLIAHIQRAGVQALDPNLAAVYKFLILLGASVESLVLAVLSSVVLIFASRRATLRQINASLIEISRKLNPPENRTDVS
jgi:hypothetical protein